MANHKILPPNFTQIPNVVFDYWMAILKSTEFTILMCLCRKIFGWHKTSDSISLNQIIKMTGLSKNSVLSSLKELEGHGLVLKIQSIGEYGNMPNEYRLHISMPKDELYTDQNLESLKSEKRWGEYQQIEQDNQNLRGGSSNSEQGVVQNLNKGVVQNLHPQKKDSTKEIHTKEITTAEGENAASRVIVFSSLDKLEIKDSLKQKISKEYSQTEVDIAVERCLKWKGRPNDETGIMTALNKADEWTDILNQDEQLQQNEDFLKSIKKFDMYNKGGIEVAIGPNYLEIVCGPKVDRVEIEENDFIIQAKALLDKYKIL